ncbi:hypothetical protein [Streptomyces sp. NPDC001380]|uniref:hypothetical protein n=1 Tax=Streptomyces sp. NPDC001380 TaxID=3364566 RepID=UPI0036C5739F
MAYDDLTPAEAKTLPVFDPSTAEKGTAYYWEDMSDGGNVLVAVPTARSSLGLSADVYGLEPDGTVTRGVEYFLADGQGGYRLPVYPGMGGLSSVELRRLAEEYSQAAAFLESIEQ